MLQLPLISFLGDLLVTFFCVYVYTLRVVATVSEEFTTLTRFILLRPFATSHTLHR